jgi:hypothetical protein
LITNRTGCCTPYGYFHSYNSFVLSLDEKRPHSKAFLCFGEIKDQVVLRTQLCLTSRQ